MDEITKKKSVRIAVLVGLGALIAFAFFMRTQFIAIYGGGHEYLSWNYFGSISRAYLDGASSVLDGQGYPFISYPPGYSLFLAAVQFLGATELHQLRLVQAFLDSLTILGIYWLLRRVGVSRVISFFGSGIYAFFGEWAIGNTTLLADWISPPLIVWLLVLIMLASEKHSIWLWAAAGALIALGTLTRPDLLLLIIPVFLCILMLYRQSSKMRAEAAAVLFCAFILPIGGWGLYNYVHHGEWIFTSTGGGNTLWEGLGDTTNPYGFVLDDGKAMQILAEHGLKWHSVEADEFFKRKYFESVVNHPLYALEVAAWRWKQIASIVDSGFWTGAFTGAQRALKDYVENAGFWIWLAAIVISWRRPMVLLLLLLPLLYAFMSIGFVHYEPRYARYAHLSYLFATIILLSVLFEYLSDRKSLWPKRSLLIGAAGIVLYSVIQYIPILCGAAQVHRFQFKATGQLKTISDLSNISFKHVVKNEVTKESDGSLLVHTDHGAFSYQLLTQISVEAAKFLYIPYKIRLIKGGFTIGLLNSGGNWLTQRSHIASGLKDGFVGIKVNGQKNVTLVIANYCPNNCQSEFELQRLDIDVEK